MNFTPEHSQAFDMSLIPDFNDPRYLDEVGWFLYHEKNEYEESKRSYAEDRMEWSGMLLAEFLSGFGYGSDWIRDKCIVSVGSGCTGDLSAWPAGSKVSVEPLAYAYHKLGMLLPDHAGTNPTLYLSRRIENLPLLDGCADGVLCRNALDHMFVPRDGLSEMWRILKPGGALYLSVDIGGDPTADEPSPFQRESLLALVSEQFEILATTDRDSHSKGRVYRMRILARSKEGPRVAVDKQDLLARYERTLRKGEAEPD